MLLEAVPEIKDHMHKLAELSKSWKGLVEVWDIIIASYIEEKSRGWDGKTYELIKSAIDKYN